MRTALLLIVLAAVGLFVVLNWSAVLAPTTLSLGVAVVQAPLGLIMLGLIGILTVLFLAYLVYLQSTVLMESRRRAKELQAQRDLADQAEASRFTELRAHLDARLNQMESSLGARLAESRAERRGERREDMWGDVPGEMRGDLRGPMREELRDPPNR